MLPDEKAEERTYEALMWLAYLKDLSSDIPNLTDPAPAVRPEDQKALDALGADLVSRMVSGEEIPLPRSDPDGDAEAGRTSEVLAAMNRGGEEGGLTPEALEEMDRQIREAENDDPDATPSHTNGH